MRILLTALHPPGGYLRFGGVQSWISTVATELYNRGDDVVVWGPEWHLPEGRFDLGILAHTKNTKRAAELCDRAIAVSHGIIAAEEPSLDIPTVFTSEEVRYHWKRLGPIIRQPIDLSFWKPDEAATPRGLVFYSYRAPHQIELNKVAQALEIPFLWIKKAAQADALTAMQEAGLVVASGRAALEAMATGTPTIIADFRPYLKKPLLCSDILLARRNNYSGRGGELANASSLLSAIHAESWPSSPRGYIAQNHHVANIVDQLLEVAGCSTS